MQLVFVGSTNKRSTSSKDTFSSSSSISTNAIEQVIENLRGKRHRASTKRNYYCIWRKFNEFFIKLDKKPRQWEDRLTLFVRYLIQEKLKSQTIKSYISAIKAVLMEDGVELNENKYLLTSLTKACKYTNDIIRTRLPIQKNLLRLILDKTEDHFAYQHYLTLLYKAVWVLAYYGMLRISEIATGEHPILASDVHISENKRKILFILRTSKTHWTDVKPQRVKITGANSKELERHCPFFIINQYIEIRGDCAMTREPFFILSDRNPITPIQVLSTLKKIIKLIGLNSDLYRTHSYRIGR